MALTSLHDLEIGDHEYLLELIQIHLRGQNGVFGEAGVVGADLLHGANDQVRGIVSTQTGGDNQVTVHQAALIFQIGKAQ